MKVLKLIIKADVNGSCEALKMTLEKIQNEEVKVQVIHSSVGGINESDVILANASKAMIIGFNVKPEAKAKQIAEKNKIDIKLYKVIYDAVDDITNIISGMLTPKFEEVVTGHAEIRQLFKISSIGTIAGSYVLDGVINRDSKVRLIRDKEVIADTAIDTLQQQKDQAKSVKMGYECGIKLKNFNDVQVGDIIEAYSLKQI
jgi:translation initiation factor IF-2